MGLTTLVLTGCFERLKHEPPAVTKEDADKVITLAQYAFTQGAYNNTQQWSTLLGPKPPLYVGDLDNSQDLSAGDTFVMEDSEYGFNAVMFKFREQPQGLRPFELRSHGFEYRLDEALEKGYRGQEVDEQTLFGRRDHINNACINTGACIGIPFNNY